MVGPIHVLFQMSRKRHLLSKLLLEKMCLKLQELFDIKGLTLQMYYTERIQYNYI